MAVVESCFYIVGCEVISFLAQTCDYGIKMPETTVLVPRRFKFLNLMFN